MKMLLHYNPLIAIPDSSDPASLWRGMYIMIGVSIITIVFAVWRYSRKKALIDRTQKVSKLINYFAKNDPLWDEKKIRKLGIDMFHMVMWAWWKNDFSKVASMVTDDLKKEWSMTWLHMKENGYVFKYEQIFVEGVNLIAASDHSDNNQDTFSISISGYIKRYLMQQSTGEVIPKHGNELEEFIDIYTFIRTNDAWLLKEIKPMAKFKDIFKTPSMGNLGR